MLGFVREERSMLRVKHCLGDETVLFFGGKFGVARGESSAKIIFECADRTFGGVAAVGIGGTSWKSMLYLRKAFCMVWDNLLSRIWSVGAGTC